MWLRWWNVTYPRRLDWRWTRPAASVELAQNVGNFKTRTSSIYSVHMVSNMPASWKRSFPIHTRTYDDLYIYIMWVIIRPLCRRVRGLCSELSTDRKAAKTSQPEKRSLWPTDVYTQFQALKVSTVQFLHWLGFKILDKSGRKAN